MRLRPLLAVLIIAIVLGAIAGPLVRERPAQDPSLEAPTEQATG